jgi:(5-formylfuran-3-yl)methyl phosphate synthase
MTGLLASVRNREEAILALEAGVDVIDLKNPNEGALGALPLHTITDIVHLVNGRSVVSATIGDLPMRSESIVFGIEHTASQGVDIVKVGFFGTHGHDACIKAMQPLAAAGIKIMAVLFADHEPDLNILPRLKAAGFYGAMLDTASKCEKNLVDHLSMEMLRGFLKRAHDLGLETGLAGSLKLSDVSSLAALQPGYLGFRGALCEKRERSGTLLLRRLEEAKKLLHESNKTAAYVESA